MRASDFMRGFSSTSAGYGLVHGSRDEKPAHGTVREDGRVYDRTCAYGGGWVHGDVFEMRERERAVRQ